MSQAQYSTQEQIEKLRGLLIAAKFDPNKMSYTDMINAIRLANFNGLYDAADHVERLIKTTTFKIEW